jgi:hypothetical protein
MRHLKFAGLVAGGVVAAVFVLSMAMPVSSQNSDAQQLLKPTEPNTASADHWLAGTDDEKFALIEKHFRGLDQAMAEIGYRYGELLTAAQTRNWDYAQYQTEKIDLSLRLAIERRPKRAKSSQPFLNAALPNVLEAAKSKDGAKLDDALKLLHGSCIECHKSENVLHFREAVERIRQRSLISGVEPRNADEPKGDNLPEQMEAQE